jgi:hypothetical protein
VKRWRYELGGTGGDGKPFSVSGHFDQGDESVSFQATLTEAQRHAYLNLTGGDTQYGKPGAGACRGPYKFERILVETVQG